uniref:Uncharacterized protein LOC109505688 n=1 Tax=Elaeis guineensis var. tenera TaxID=51953 RepID=A0A6J0PGQ7_ELAGV|nr:uncharacterized protein LOC109505688 [Elaeis guineensis]XP_019705150.1 uncharacterized protein LOC109505688 [Elaeis guineensis]XP_019705151.1 uncharacterized protein LOC109505688 [Elaeis guineensis]XP_029118982.1 uncharacterized protein LOC109505688 [Elaeis guineensis]XP_029118983.1 uncharacterized protein LOC109505688 [Elaeis guineensis]
MKLENKRRRKNDKMKNEKKKELRKKKLWEEKRMMKRKNIPGTKECFALTFHFFLAGIKICQTHFHRVGGTLYPSDSSFSNQLVYECYQLMLYMQPLTHCCRQCKDNLNWEITLETIMEIRLRHRVGSDFKNSSSSMLILLMVPSASSIWKEQYIFLYAYHNPADAYSFYLFSHAGVAQWDILLFILQNFRSTQRFGWINQINLDFCLGLDIIGIPCTNIITLGEFKITIYIPGSLPYHHYLGRHFYFKWLYCSQDSICIHVWTSVLNHAFLTLKQSRFQNYADVNTEGAVPDYHILKFFLEIFSRSYSYAPIFGHSVLIQCCPVKYLVLIVFDLICPYAILEPMVSCLYAAFL